MTRKTTLNIKHYLLFLPLLLGVFSGDACRDAERNELIVQTPSSEDAVVLAQAPAQEPPLLPGGVGIPGTSTGYPTLKFRGQVWLTRELDSHNSSGMTNPFDTELIGPVIALRAKLSNMQVASLGAHVPEGPVLVRFEIYDAWSDHSHVEYIGSPRLDEDLSPFRMRALLYWAHLRTGSDTPIGSVRLRYHKGEKASLMHGAQLGKVIVEKREFVVRPQKSRKLGTSIIQQDWVVEGDGTIVESETRTVGDFNEAVAFFDISQRAFEKPK